MNRRRIIFLGVLIMALAGLSAALWWTRPPVPEAPDAVSSIAPPQIHHITVQTRDNVIELDRSTETNQWRLSAPADARADADRVAALLDLAALIPQRRLAADAVDDTDTGLDDPGLVLRFNDEAPIAVGGTGPAPDTRYVRTAHALLVVAAGHLEDQPLGWTHWLAPNLIADDAVLRRITLPRITLTRNDTGGWQVAPVGEDRGADYAQATVDAWHYSRALAIEPVDASRARMARITLVFAGDQKRQLDLIARSPELILRDNDLGVDYILAANQAGPLLDMRHPDLLRQSRGADLQPSAIPLTETGTNIEPTEKDRSSANKRQ